MKPRIACCSIFALAFACYGEDHPAVCSPAAAFVDSGESVSITVWPTDPSPGSRIGYSWNADARQVRGTGATVEWDSADARPGLHEITVSIRSDKRTEECVARIVVGEQLLGFAKSPAVNGAAFLVAGAAQQRDFGFYGYLLLTKTSSRAIREAQRAAIIQVMLAPPTKELERALGSKAGIVATHIPVTEDPPKRVRNANKPDALKDAADWLLDRYDFATAAVMLSAISASTRDIVFLGMPAPFEAGRGLPEPVQRVTIPSDATVNDIQLWVKHCMLQAQQALYSGGPATGNLGLRLRSVLTRIGFNAVLVMRAVQCLKGDGTACAPES